MKNYYYEIYITGPKNEKGWDIKTGTINATNRLQAINKLRQFELFDCVIQCYQVSSEAII